MSVSPVCRTCLVIISGDKTGHNIDDEKALQSAREMISFCVPEMDTYVSMSPSICDNCFDVLINFYNFKVRCLQVESAIRSYIAANNVMESTSVDLRNVARLQALEAMKQMNWSHSTGRQFIATVDKCLDPKKTTEQQTVLIKCGKSAIVAASTALPIAKGTARQSPIDDSSKKDASYIKVRKDLMPGKQKANSALTVNPVNYFASKVADKQTGQGVIIRKPYDALQLCPVTGVLKKYAGKGPRRVSKSDDVIIEDSHQSDDDEVILINDNEQDSVPAKGLEKAQTVKTYSSKRKLQRPVAVDETVAKRPKVQASPDPSLPISPKKNEKQLVVRLRKEPMWKCSFCQYVALKISTLMAHYYRCHKVCKLCNFRCVRTYALNKHISQKHITQLREVSEFYENATRVTDFICGLCKFSGKVALDLVQHRLEKHIKKDQHEYICPFLYCAFQHDVAMKVAEHIDQTHDRPDRKECLMCNFVASSVVKLKRHAEFHDQTRSTCTVCGYSCKTSLKKHMEKSHQITNWVQDDTVVGMVADDVLMYYDKLTSSDDFKITLASSGPAKYTVPSASTVAPGNDDETYSWDQPSLSEMLSGHVLAQLPQQQDAAELVDDIVADKVAKISKSSKKKGKQLKKTNVLNDSDDCVLVGDVGRAVVTIDLSDENELHSSDAQKTCSEKSSEEPIVEDDLSSAALSRGSNEAEAVGSSGNADNSQSSETFTEKNPGQDVGKDNEDPVSESVDNDDTELNSPIRNEGKEVENNCPQDSLKEVDSLPAEPSSLSKNEGMEITDNSRNAPLEDLCASGEAPKSVVENCSDKQNSNQLVQGKCDE